MLRIDTKGNVAIQYRPFNGGITTNTSWSASFFATTSINFAPSLDELNGMGYSIGGSGISPYYGLGGGVDVNIAEASEHTYLGFTASAGIGAPVSAEFHVNWGNTKTIEASRFNIYEEIYRGIDLLRSRCLQ